MTTYSDSNPKGLESLLREPAFHPILEKLELPDIELVHTYFQVLWRILDTSPATIASQYRNFLRDQAPRALFIYEELALRGMRLHKALLAISDFLTDMINTDRQLSEEFKERFAIHVLLPNDKEIEERLEIFEEDIETPESLVELIRANALLVLSILEMEQISIYICGLISNSQNFSTHRLTEIVNTFTKRRTFQSNTLDISQPHTYFVLIIFGMILVSCLGNILTKSSDLFQNRISSCRPSEGM